MVMPIRSADVVRRYAVVQASGARVVANSATTTYSRAGLPVPGPRRRCELAHPRANTVTSMLSQSPLPGGQELPRPSSGVVALETRRWATGAGDSAGADP